MNCRIPSSQLAALIAGELTANDQQALEEHTRTCLDCGAMLQQMRNLTHVVAQTEPPAESASARRAVIARALAQARAGSAPAPARRITWALSAGFGLATFAAVAVVVVATRDTRPQPRIAQGSVNYGPLRLEAGAPWQGAPNRTATEQIATAATDVTVELAQAWRLDIKAGTTFLLDSRGGWHAELKRGEMVVAGDTAAKDPLIVKAYGGTVQVLGALASVTSDDEGTRIVVRQGAIQARRDGETSWQSLQSGQETLWTQPHKGLSKKEEEIQPKAPPAPPTETPQVSRPILRHPVQTVRKEIQAGRFAQARSLLRQVDSAAYNRTSQAELRLVEAELLFAEKKYSEAIAGYLAVVERFGDTRHAETALFAAAQVSLDHDTQAQRSIALLQRYLKRYPQGTHAEETTRLLNSLNKR